MAGVKALRRIQLGRETTAGTAVASTAIWRGMGTFEDQLETVFVEEDVGYLSGQDRTYIPKVQGTLEMDSVEATFEQLPHIFEAGIKTINTGVVDTGGSGKIYAYGFCTNAATTIKTYTLEGGDNQQAEEMAYCFVSEFGLEGKAGEGVMVEATWLGRQLATTTFTGSIALPAVEEIPFSKGKLYIDTTGGTIGTTNKANTLLGMSLKCITGWAPVYTADGALYFSFAKQVAPELTCELTFEHDATSVAEIAAWRAGTARLIRVEFLGTALTTAGSAHTYKTLRLDMAGKWEKFEKIDEQDGNDIVTGTFRSRYNGTGAQFATITVVNEVETVP